MGLKWPILDYSWSNLCWSSSPRCVGCGKVKRESVLSVPTFQQGCLCDGQLNLQQTTATLSKQANTFCWANVQVASRDKLGQILTNSSSLSPCPCPCPLKEKEKEKGKGKACCWAAQSFLRRRTSFAGNFFLQREISIIELRTDERRKRKKELCLAKGESNN